MSGWRRGCCSSRAGSAARWGTLCVSWPCSVPPPLARVVEGNVVRRDEAERHVPALGRAAARCWSRGSSSRAVGLQRRLGPRIASRAGWLRRRVPAACTSSAASRRTHSRGDGGDARRRRRGAAEPRLGRRAVGTAGPPRDRADRRQPSPAARLVPARHPRPSQRASHPDDATRHLGIPVDVPRRTLLDLAATAAHRELERAAEEAEVQRRGHTSFLSMSSCPPIPHDIEGQRH